MLSATIRSVVGVVHHEVCREPAEAQRAQHRLRLRHALELGGLDEAAGRRRAERPRSRAGRHRHAAPAEAPARERGALGAVAALHVVLVGLGEADHDGAHVQLVAVARFQRAQRRLKVVGPRTRRVREMQDLDEIRLIGGDGGAPGHREAGNRHPRSLAVPASSSRGCARRRRRSWRGDCARAAEASASGVRIRARDPSGRPRCARARPRCRGTSSAS